MSNPQEDILRRIMAEVTNTLTADLREVLTASLERQISTTLTQALLESEFYRRISKDMRGGLKRIYKEINAAAKSTGPETPGIDKERADKLFHEASEQLSAVLSQTEKAAEDIMEFVEQHMDIQNRSSDVIKNIQNGSATKEDIDWLAESNNRLGDDLNNVLMSLSFQDLTGQRIKRAVKALQEIESTVVELYLSTGLLIQAYEETPDKNLNELEAEAQFAVSNLKGEVVNSELKGPSADVNQKNIDDLLAQLGMD